MEEVIKLLIGLIVLLVGIPIGNYLAKITREELASGQRWFKLMIVLSLLGAIIGLIVRNDALLFTFLFISIVTSRSLKKDKSKRNKKG